MNLTPDLIEASVLRAVSVVMEIPVTDLSRLTPVDDLELNIGHIMLIFERLEKDFGQDIPYEEAACSEMTNWATLGEFMDWLGVVM